MTAIVKIAAKCQTTIPQDIRADLGVGPGEARNRSGGTGASSPWRPRARVHGFPVGMPGSVTNDREYHHQP